MYFYKVNMPCVQNKTTPQSPPEALLSFSSYYHLGLPKDDCHPDIKEQTFIFPIFKLYVHGVV